MIPITLKDRSYIYNQDTLKEYLNNLGFDIEDLRKLLCQDLIEEIRYEGYAEAKQEYERMADGYFCAARDIAQGIDDLCDDFRKKYKSKAILNVLDEIQSYIRVERID